MLVSAKLPSSALKWYYGHIACEVAHQELMSERLERTQIFRDVGNPAFSALLNVEAPQELLKVDDKDKRRRGVVKQLHAS